MLSSVSAMAGLCGRAVVAVGFTLALLPAAEAGTITYAAYSDIKDWDPAAAFSLESIMLMNVYEPLVRFEAVGDGGRVIPALAEAWSQSEDKLSWTFKLRTGVKFHDGTAFDAAAAKAALDRTIRLKQGAAYIWDAVQSIDAPDAATLIIRTRQAAPIDLIACAQYGAYLYSSAAAEKGTAWFSEGRASGTGPYRVVAWHRGEDLVLEANPDYWNGGTKGRADRVVIKIVREASSQVQLIRSGAADIITLAPSDLLPSLKKDSAIRVMEGRSWMNSQFLLNMKKEPTDNQEFRRALTLAWDYATVAESIYGGGAEIARGVIPQTMWGHDANLAAPRFDLAEAKTLVEKSGVPPARRRITASYIATSSEYSDAMLLFQANLAQIGVTLDLEPGPWEVIWDKSKNPSTAPNMISMTWWPTYPSPSDWLVGLFYTQDRPLFNLSYYSDARFDEIVDSSRKLEGIDRGLAVFGYQKAQKRLIEAAPAIFYADLKIRLVHRADLDGIKLNPAYVGIFFADIRRKSAAP